VPFNTSLFTTSSRQPAATKWHISTSHSQQCSTSVQHGSCPTNRSHLNQCSMDAAQRQGNTGCCLANQCSHSAALHSACSHATATALPSNAAWTLLSARATRGVAWPIIAATVLPGLLSAASLLHSHPITAQPVELCSVTVALLPSSILPSVSAQCQSLRTTAVMPCSWQCPRGGSIPGYWLSADHSQAATEQDAGVGVQCAGRGCLKP
jgi:hypothetical protein